MGADVFEEPAVERREREGERGETDDLLAREFSGRQWG